MVLFPRNFMINGMTLILILILFLDGAVPRCPSYGVCSHVEDFNARRQLNFSNRVIGIISLERLIPSSITDPLN